MQISMVDVKELQDFLVRYINAASVTPQDNGASGILSEFLSHAGFKVEIMNFGPVSNVFATIGNARGPHLLFAGHHDVVPTGDQSLWTVPPFDSKVVNGVLYGRGAVDMKGGVAAFIFAARHFLDNNPSFNGSISILITGDEEADSSMGMQKILPQLSDRGVKFDFAIIGEPTSEEKIGDTIKIGRRGSANYKLEVKGKQGHVAYPQFARNPISDLVKILSDFVDYEFDQGDEYFPPSHLEVTSIVVPAGANNVIPASAAAQFNIRFGTASAEGRIVHLDNICRKYTNECVLSETISGKPFVVVPSPMTYLMQDVVAKCTGQKPKLSTSGGTSDARFLHKYCPLVELGLLNRTAHKVDENVPLSDLETLSLIYGDYIESFFVSS